MNTTRTNVARIAEAVARTMGFGEVTLYDGSDANGITWKVMFSRGPVRDQPYLLDTHATTKREAHAYLSAYLRGAMDRADATTTRSN